MRQQQAVNLLFHQGALGDWVLTFPILRALDGSTVVVTSWSKAKLAAALFDHVEAMDIELREFSRLHAIGGPAPVGPAVKQHFERARVVISFVSDGFGAWSENVRRLTPGAKHIFVEPKPPSDWKRHVTRWHAEQLHQQGLPISQSEIPLRINSDGPVVVHPGSGSSAKCWSADRYEQVCNALSRQGQRLRVVLGEVEIETWPASRLEHWIDQLGAEAIDDLDQLWRILQQASCYVGNDSGPTHLAAQLGLPTLALFGPTQAEIWGPVGPAVNVLAPPQPQQMSWLGVDAVLAALEKLRR